MLTMLLALLALAWIGTFAYRAVVARIDYRVLVICCVLSIIPIMFLWASIQAWRLMPTGIVSVSSGYLLFGFLGFAANILRVLFDRAWSDTSQDGLFAGISLLAFVIGVMVAMQKRRLTKNAV